MRSTWEVRTAIYEHLEGHDEDVVIDMTDVNADRRDRAQGPRASRPSRPAGAGHHLTLRGCGPAVRRMLHLSRLIRLVEVERQAVSA